MISDGPLPTGVCPNYRLWGMRAYLIGAIDRAPDLGVSWRNDITTFLEPLGVVVLNPHKKPIKDVTFEFSIENREYRHKLKEAEDYDKIAEGVRLVRIVDLRMVDISDFLIVNLDVSIHACGTYEEISWANRIKRPILIHCEQGKKSVPDWLLGMIPHQHIFSTWQEIKDYLINIHTADTVDHMNRWMFFDYASMMPKVAVSESIMNSQKGK